VNADVLPPAADGFPKAAWLNTAGGSADTGTPAFVTLLPCLSSDLPAPYGSLKAHVAPGDTQFQVDPSTGTVAIPSVPPGAPFPITIGAERMLVTKVSGNNTWTVTRHTGGTTADPAGYDQG